MFRKKFEGLYFCLHKLTFEFVAPWNIFTHWWICFVFTYLSVPVWDSTSYIGSVLFLSGTNSSILREPLHLRKISNVLTILLMSVTRREFLSHIFWTLGMENSKTGMCDHRLLFSFLLWLWPAHSHMLGISVGIHREAFYFLWRGILLSLLRYAFLYFHYQSHLIAIYFWKFF